MLRRLLVLLLIAPHAAAQGYVTDGFGILPTEALGPERAAWSGLRTGPRGADLFAPEAPDTVLFFLGPKSLTAGADDGHAVALGLDRHGNLVANGTEAAFALGPQRSDGFETRAGIAHSLFRPAPAAGTQLGGASLGARQSARATFRVTADLSDIAPQMRAHSDDIVMETITTLGSAPLSDRFGNPAEDGVSTTITLDHGDSSTLVTALVTDGRATARLLTRDMPQTVSATMTLGRAVSAPAMNLTVQPMRLMADIPAMLRPLPDIAALQLSVGPVQTDAGYLLNDGAEISVTLEAVSGVQATVTGWLRDGHFDALVPLDPQAGPFHLTITTASGELASTLSALRDGN
jgi:hypothetical protein